MRTFRDENFPEEAPAAVGSSRVKTCRNEKPRLAMDEAGVLVIAAMDGKSGGPPGGVTGF